NNEKQNVVTYTYPQSHFKKHTTMTLTQNNINSLIGSDFGVNTFIGNSHSNNFVVGAADTKIHLCGGANIIAIPDANRKNFKLSIFLGSVEHHQHINIGCK
ncbi:hypothetical protein LQ897_005222, partial [Escherichia coli]|nr:hypothetical protein [Escherichia coli]